MVFAVVHLTTLFMAPQLWIEPFVGMRVDYFLYPPWILYVVATGRINKIRFGPQEKFYIFWIFWLSISLLANGVFFERFGTIIFYYVKWFVLYILVSATLNTKDNIFQYVFWIVIFSSILAVEGIQHYHNEIGWAGQQLGWSAGDKGRTQWINIFDGPGVFCVVYTISLPFLLLIIKKGNSFFLKITGLSLIILFGVAIYVNGSRGGLLTALAIFMIHYGMKYYKKNKFVIIMSGVAVLGVFAVMPSHMTEVSDSHHSSAHRVEMWAEGCEMVKQNPVFGIGRGGFASYTGKLVAHNSFVEIMGETGAIGLFAWMGLIYFSLKQLVHFIKNAKKDENKVRNRDTDVAYGLFLSIIGYLLSSMFVTLEYETLYMLLGVCAAFAKHSSQAMQWTLQDFKFIAAGACSWIVVINLFTLVFGPGAFI